MSLISVLLTTILLKVDKDSLTLRRSALMICQVFRGLNLCLLNILFKYFFSQCILFCLVCLRKFYIAKLSFHL